MAVQELIAAAKAGDASAACGRIVYRRRRPRKMRNVTAGVLSVRFLDGDRRLPILRLRGAA